MAPFLRPLCNLALLLLAATGGQARLQYDEERRIQSIPNTPLYPESWPFMSNCLKPTSTGGLLDTSLPSCEGGQSDIRKTDRIAIVGAGPGGLTMAYLLKKRGFSDITIFEKEDRVGGKSKNFEYGGDKFDLGTVYTANKYECVELLFDEFNMTEIGIDTANKPRVIKDITIDFGDPTIAAFWYIAYTVINYGVTLSGPEAFGDMLQQNVMSYIALWTQSMGSFDHYFPDEATVDFDLINISFLEWLEERKLFALISRLNIAVSGQGYGSLDEIPAFYGLMWIHPNFFVGGGTFSILSQDWQTLWETIVDALDLTIILESSISKIERNENNVKIMYRKINKPQMHVEKFDKLIMAMPMPDALKILDSTQNEIDLFSKYNYKSVRTDLGKVKNPGFLAAGASPGIPYNVELFTWIGRPDQQTDYHVKSFDPSTKEMSRYQWKTDGIDGIVTYQRQALLKQRERNEDVTYLFSIVSLDDLDGPNALNSEAESDLASLEIEYEHIITNRVPDYMPWKNTTDIVDERVPWKIWDYQGTMNTWFVGNYVSFESVADILDYNLKLVNKRLCED